jgi:hypothetical protein
MGITGFRLVLSCPPHTYPYLIIADTLSLYPTDNKLLKNTSTIASFSLQVKGCGAPSTPTTLSIHTSMYYIVLYCIILVFVLIKQYTTRRRNIHFSRKKDEHPKLEVL